MLVDVQAEMLPLATVPNAGVTNAGLVNVPVLTVGFVMTGVTSVGVVLNTNTPVPVSSVIAVRKLALVGFAKKV
jgi:lipid-binding SYLF domain-containing protein